MRFTRLENIIGKKNLSLLKDQTVIVFGLGGVGSYAAEALVRSNIGHLIIVDFDRVDRTNINRQLIATEDTVGEFKVDVFLRRAKSIHPKIDILGLKEKVSYDNVDEFVSLKPDFVLDCIDDVEGKMALIKACESHQIPIILAMGFANKCHPEFIQIGPLKSTSVCPLAKVIRKRVKMTGLSMDVPCVFSVEQPIEVYDKSVLGSTAFTPSAAGLIMASYVVNRMIREDE